MRRLTALTMLAATATATATATPQAHADTLNSSRFEMTETAHDVAVRVDRGFATLTVQRTFRNPGPIADHAIVMIDLPELGVATGLRTRSDSGRWFDGELMDAEDAAKKYRELTGLGGAYPKDPALLSWRSQSQLELQVFPVTAKRDKTVEYTVLIPLTYADGVYKARVPALGTTLRNATLHFSAAQSGDVVRVNGVPVTSDAAIDSKALAQIELTPRGALSFAGHVSTLALENDRALFRAHWELPARLGAIPQNPALAVVIDTSRSMMNADAGVAAIARARAYLQNFSRASVTVVAFNRKVETPFGVNVPVQDALASLANWNPKPQNGSELEAAILRADAAVAASPNPTKRIVVLTDLETRRGIDESTFAKLPLKSGAIVHVGIVSEGNALARDDDSAWSALPRRTGGVLWHAGVGDAKVYEEWARPMRVDKVEVDGMPADFYAPATYDEGASLEHFTVRDGDATAIRLHGELWAQPVHVEFSANAAEDKRTAALAFGHSVLYSLTEAEQRILAMRGGAVSPVTSYLAVEPGVRPSFEGLENVGGIGLGGGSSSSRCTCCGTQGRPPDSQPMRPPLQAALDAAWEKCLGHGKVTADVSTTRLELVEIVATASPRNATTEACVAEQLWQFEPDAQVFTHAAVFTLVATR